MADLQHILSGTGDEQKSRDSEKLNEYSRIGSPGIIALILGLVLVVAALLVWGFTGEIPVTTTQRGLVGGDAGDSHTIACFVDVREGISAIPEGNPANIQTPDGSTFAGTVSYMSDFPQSQEELLRLYDEMRGSEELGPWVMKNTLGDGEFAYLLLIDTEEELSDYRGELAYATVVIRMVPPISYLLG